MYSNWFFGHETCWNCDILGLRHTAKCCDSDIRVLRCKRRNTPRGTRGAGFIVNAALSAAGGREVQGEHWLRLRGMMTGMLTSSRSDAGWSDYENE